jgi:DNA-binding XRE family transcriptional regulator
VLAKERIGKMANNKEYTFDDYLNEQLKDPESRKEWDALEPAYKFKELRIRKCISQADLAKKLHTRQPSIARLESGQGIRNLTFLKRVAEALDAEVVIQVVPRTLSEPSSVKYPRPKRKSRKKAVA